jgi:N6-adenosine-specific RNA methylase IME4
LAGFIIKEIVMLFCAKSATDVVASTSTADTGKIRLGGGYRLPASTTDNGKIRLGGGYRLPASTTDNGKIRLGGGYRLPVNEG